MRKNIKNFDDRPRYDEICYDKVQWFWEWTRSLTNHFRFSNKYARSHVIILRVVKMLLGLITIARFFKIRVRMVTITLQFVKIISYVSLRTKTSFIMILLNIFVLFNYKSEPSFLFRGTKQYKMLL